jgi:hypothetical protein
MSEKPEEKLEQVKRAIERRDDKIEQAVEKVEPELHAARQRLAEAAEHDEGRH